MIETCRYGRLQQTMAGLAGIAATGEVESVIRHCSKRQWLLQAQHLHRDKRRTKRQKNEPQDPRVQQQAITVVAISCQ